MNDETLARAREARAWGRYAEALQLLSEVLHTQPSAAAWLERGQVYLELNDRRQARLDFDAASHADPTGATGDIARRELLQILNPFVPPHLASQQRGVPNRRLPHPWARTLVVLLLIASLSCALVSIIGYGRYPLRPALPTAVPTRFVR